MNGYIKLKEYWQYFIPLIIAIVAVFLAHVMSLNMIYGVLFAIILFLVALSIIFYSSCIKDGHPPHSWLVKIYTSKDEKAWEKEINLISEAKDSVKILGISHRTRLARPDFEDTLIQAGEAGVEITILILDNDGANLVPKAVDEGADPNSWKSHIASSNIQFKQIKRDHPRINVELYTYDIFPIWHMVIIDDNKCLIGYYPTGRPGGKSPLYLITEGDLSLLTPFIKYFNNIKDSGKRIIPK
jgi:hypothetical protein